MSDDYAIKTFESAAAWRQWLSQHYDTADGIWIRIYKKASGLPTVQPLEALDDALCYGWIDGLRRSGDEQSYLQKFTPRRKASMWSKRNIEFVERLTAAGLMLPSGLAKVERAKADGRWAAAYDKPSEMKVPADFLAELKKHPKAEAFFVTLNKSNTYAIAWRLQTAKTAETRLRRQTKIVAMLDAGERLH